MAVRFVDRDMIMHYFGGGVGHLKNTPPQQAHRLDTDSEEMEVEDEEGNTGGNTGVDPQDIIMSNGELEVGEDDEMGQDDNVDESDDDNDDGSDDDDASENGDEESAHGSDENEDEDYGYGSL
jgi:hypothetical protein